MRTSISVSVPFNWVDDIADRADEKGFPNRSEYVRDLIQKDIDEDDETPITLATDGNVDIEEEA